MTQGNPEVVQPQLGRQSETNSYSDNTESEWPIAGDHILHIPGAHSQDTSRDTVISLSWPTKHMWTDRTNSNALSTPLNQWTDYRTNIQCKLM